jgi:hypothetical protein
MDRSQNRIRKMNQSLVNCIFCVNNNSNSFYCEICDGLTEFIHTNNRKIEAQDQLYNEACDKIDKLNKDLHAKQFLLEATEQDLNDCKEYCSKLLKRLGNLVGRIHEVLEKHGEDDENQKRSYSRND